MKELEQKSKTILLRLSGRHRARHSRQMVDHGSGAAIRVIGKPHWKSCSMTNLAPNVSTSPSRTVEGILCVQAGMLLFVAQDGLMKSMLGAYTVWTLIFARSVVTVLLLVPVIMVLGRPYRLLTPLWPWHLLRAALFATGFTLFYAAFPFMGLAEVTTIFFSAPLITACLAALFLHEIIGWHRISALLIGFGGVTIAINPAGDSFTWIAILPLICAATYAASLILARRIGEQETTLTMGLYTIALAGVLMVGMGWLANQLFDFGPEFAHLAWEWPEPSQETLTSLALLGGVGMMAYLLLTRAYQIANASLIAPFDYSYLPFATIMAYLVWGEIPGWNTLTGMLLIVLSGLYIGYREIKSSRRKVEPALISEAAFAPGNPVAPLAINPDTDDQTKH
jgi:drug/metabolite transporter (DMT)-like permease